MNPLGKRAFPRRTEISGLTLWGMMRVELSAIRTDLRDLANRVGTLERRQARLEGLIEGAGLFPATDARQGESVPA